MPALYSTLVYIKELIYIALGYFTISNPNIPEYIKEN
jgi:hypothetical protein